MSRISTRNTTLAQDAAAEDPRLPRDAESRRAQILPNEAPAGQWSQASMLAVPDVGPHWHCRWIRERVGNEFDDANIQAALGPEQYRWATLGELREVAPEFAMTVPVDDRVDISRAPVRFGSMRLAWRHNAFREQEQAYITNERAMRLRGIGRDIPLEGVNGGPAPSPVRMNVGGEGRINAADFDDRVQRARMET